MELKDITKVKEAKNSYILNDSVAVPKADGNSEYELIKQWLALGNTLEPEFTPEQIESQRQATITNYATQIIEKLYPPLAQRKMMSTAIAIQDKRLEGIPLTVEEQTKMQQIRDINAWITTVRTIENMAIANPAVWDYILAQNELVKKGVREEPTPQELLIEIQGL